ncbi:hypothetical protein HWV62_41671 [Athelia sp. TMB]|nr:hypothetical protein HWV62_41671 [Athelia sp. TMB]
MSEQPTDQSKDTLGAGSSEDDSLSNEPGDQPIISKLFTDAELYDRYLTEHGYAEGGTTSVAGFADLVAGGLDDSEKAITGRLAKIAVRGETWTSGENTEEPESYEGQSDDSEDSLPEADTPDTSVHADGSDPHIPLRSSTTNNEQWKLEPEEVVNLLVEEFGPLAGDGEQEKLLVETDGAMFQDVFILGVMHLTTHRIAFHASLLSTRPDLTPQQQIVKAGPAIIHTQTRWHKKRRVWMEIAHDMMSTYASSRDEDHIRPLRTVLRALYLYRHRRRQALGGADSAEDLNGVRLSIPLAHIKSFDEGHCFSFSYLLTLHVDMELLDTHPQTHLDDGKVPTKVDDNPETKLRFVSLRPDAAWDRLQEYIDEAKSAAGAAAQNVIIDFGPLSFVEADGPSDNWGDTEAAIREALALGNEPDLSIFRGRIHRSICSTGYFVVSSHYVGFWSKSFASAAIRYRLPISLIRGAHAVYTKLMRGNCVSIELEGQGDVQFDFKTGALRDSVLFAINAALESHRLAQLQRLSMSEPATPSAASDNSMGPTSTPQPIGVPRSPQRSATGIFSPLTRTMNTVLTERVPRAMLPMLPKAINVPQDTLFTHPSMHFVCLTIGSRGDVQPYIALGLGLQKEGHRVTIVTHEEYREWIVSFGIAHKSAGGDPGALMKLSVENKVGDELELFGPADLVADVLSRVLQGEFDQLPTMA